MTRLEQFFYDHAGYGYDPETETPEHAQQDHAVQLAAALHYAIDHLWHFEWAPDRDEPCNCGERNCGHTVEYCQLWGGYRVLASLSAICGATDDYRRVVEAELALEARATHKAEIDRLYDELTRIEQRKDNDNA